MAKDVVRNPWRLKKDRGDSPESTNRRLETQGLKSVLEYAKARQLDLEQRFEPLLATHGLRLPDVANLIQTIKGQLEHQWDPRNLSHSLDQIMVSPLTKLLDKFIDVNRDLEGNNQAAIAKIYKDSVTAETPAILSDLLKVYGMDFDLLQSRVQNCGSSVEVVRHILNQLNQLVENSRNVTELLASQELAINATLRELNRAVATRSEVTARLDQLEIAWSSFQRYEQKFEELRTNYHDLELQLHRRQSEIEASVTDYRHIKKQVDYNVSLFNTIGHDLYTLLAIRPDDRPELDETWFESTGAVPEMLVELSFNPAPLRERVTQAKERALTYLEEVTKPPPPPPSPLKVKAVTREKGEEIKREVERVVESALAPAEFALMVYAAICSMLKKQKRSHPRSGRTIRIMFQSILVPAGQDQDWTESDFGEAVMAAEKAGWLQPFQPSRTPRHLCWQPSPAGWQQAETLWSRCSPNFRRSLQETNQKLKDEQARFRERLGCKH